MSDSQQPEVQPEQTVDVGVVVSDVTVDSADSLSKQQRSKRVQMIDVLDIYVPPPRVRNHFTKKMLDVEKHFEFKPVQRKKDDAGSSTPAPSEEAQAPHDESQDVRLSPEANAALAVTASTLLVSVIKYAMENALSAKMKRVTVAHFLARKLDGLEGSVLMKHLPVVHQRLAAAASAPADKAQQPAVEVAEAAVEPTAEAAGKKDPEFTTYVARAFNDVKSKDAKYGELMLTNDLKTFLSTLLIEFIQSVAPLSMVFIEAMDLRTVKQRVVMKAIKAMLSLSGEFELFNAYKQAVDEKIKLFESYEKGEHDMQKKEQASVAATPEPAAAVAEPVA